MAYLGLTSVGPILRDPLQRRRLVGCSFCAAVPFSCPCLTRRQTPRRAEQSPSSRRVFVVGAAGKQVTSSLARIETRRACPWTALELSAANAVGCMKPSNASMLIPP